MESLRWYHSTWFIAVLFAFWFLIIPIIIGCILISKKERLIKLWEIDKIQEFEHIKNELVLKEAELMENVRQFEEEKMVERKNLELQKQNEEKIIQEKMRLRKIELENEFNISKKEAINIQLRYEREKKDYLKQLERQSKRKLHQIKRLKRLQKFFMREIIVLKDELLEILYYF
ncbi:hypothetical protein [Bacillus thermotolerans]|uniref:Uncharacterized protein n=1 Tax=Bacillus thermotolerans TaxID=1221996 RepID=A0A0F5HM93_BACTR|nr:hypothetical protein [Bacillus thermotolerans]KKB34140.1 hypothetical protein QY95_04026 [Bacillus thermotolerans]